MEKRINTDSTGHGNLRDSIPGAWIERTHGWTVPNSIGHPNHVATDRVDQEGTSFCSNNPPNKVDSLCNKLREFAVFIDNSLLARLFPPEWTC